MIQQLQLAQQQGSTTGRLLAETVQSLHPHSRLSAAQQAQFDRCCAYLVVAHAATSCPKLLLTADVCFNYAYQLDNGQALGCPRHIAQDMA